DVAKSRHPLDDDENRPAPGWLRESSDCLLVLCPEPGSDGFPNVLQGFPLVRPLGDAPRQRWALRDNPSVLRCLQRHVKGHLSPIPAPRSGSSQPGMIASALLPVKPREPYSVIS